MELSQKIEAKICPKCFRPECGLRHLVELAHGRGGDESGVQLLASRGRVDGRSQNESRALQKKTIEGNNIKFQRKKLDGKCT
jgi:hypothetical protein